MGLSRMGVGLVAVSLWTAHASAQQLPTWQSRCLHGAAETEVQAQRRNEALDTADLIHRVIDRRPRGTGYPANWEAVGKLPGVASYRGMAGKRGDLARKIEWGSDDPLPGWRIHYVASQHGYAFSLTDSRDPCGLTFTSDEGGVVIEGHPADRSGQVRVIPLDSTH